MGLSVPESEMLEENQSVLVFVFSLLSSHCRSLQAQFLRQLLGPGHYNLNSR